MRGGEVDMLQILLLHVFETLVSALCLRDLAAQVVLTLVTSMKENISHVSDGAYGIFVR